MKKAQATGKIVRESMVAAKMGGPDPEGNARLAAAVEKARKESVSRDVIERAIKKGAGVGEGQARSGGIEQKVAPGQEAVVAVAHDEARRIDVAALLAKMLKTRFFPDLVVMYPESVATPLRVPVLAWITPRTGSAPSLLLSVPSVPLTARVLRNRSK